MTRHAEIALSYATGTVQTFTIEEMVTCLEDIADGEGVPQDMGDMLRQAAQRLKANMTPKEIRERLIAITKAAGALYARADVYTFGHYGEAPAQATVSFGDRISIEAKGTDWPSVIDTLEAKVRSSEWEKVKVEALAKDLLTGGNLSAENEARFGERARARAKEMAEAFVYTTQPKDAAE